MGDGWFVLLFTLEDIPYTLSNILEQQKVIFLGLFLN